MKTKLQIIGIALIGLLTTSCSTSMNMSKTADSTNDDIYYSPTKKTTSIIEAESTSLANEKKEPKELKVAELEEKYSKILASDSTTVDTLIYKAESTNPYERILSDSYQESYERRLRGMEDPRYGMENFTIYHSSDFFLANAYDPAFYRIIVMGDQIWVEPNYIASMFSWPRNNFWAGVGFGLGFGWNSWYYNNYYSPYYWNSSWLGYNPYWNSYPYNYWNNNIAINDNSYYGRRAGNTTNLTASNRRMDRSYENQIISSRQRNGSSTNFGLNRTDVRTRNTNQSDITTRNGQRNNNQEVRRGNRNENYTTTRLRGEATTRNINSTEPTRRNSNNTYQRPRSTNTDGYIRTGTRNQNTESSGRDNTTRNTTVRDNRNASPTYNRPSRVDSSTERTRTTNSGSTNRETTNRGSGGNSGSGSYSTPRSSSGSSSSTTTNSNTQQNSSSSGTRKR